MYEFFFGLAPDTPPIGVIDMADVVEKVINGNDTNNAGEVQASNGRSHFVVKTQDVDNPDLTVVEATYTNKFDEVGYYFT